MANAPKLQGTEKIGESYYKINLGIDNANEALIRSRNAESSSSSAINIANNGVNTATNIANNAVNTASKAEIKAENTQKQLDTLVIKGDSSVEAAQARTDADGNTSNNLKERLDTMQKNQKAIITFTFDDGFSEDNLTYCIFKEYKMVCSFALITDRIFNQNMVDLYRQYEQEGFTLMSHSCNHKDMSTGDMSIQEASYELEQSQRKLQLYGLSANGFVTPMSTLNDKYADILERTYNYAFTVYGGTLPASNIGHMDITHDPYKLARVSLSRNSVEKIKATIDNCIRERGLLVFYDHRTGAPGENVSEEKLRQILDYVKAKTDLDQCRVLNTNDAMNSFFGIQLSEPIQNVVKSNLAPSFMSTGTSLDTDSWLLSKHLNDVGETYSAQFENNEPIGIIQFPNGASIGKESSLQMKVDMTRLNMNVPENQSLYVAFDLSTPQYASSEFSIEVRFYDKSGTFDVTHKTILNVTDKRQHFEIVATPSKMLDFSHALVYFRFKATNVIGDPFNIKVYKSVCGFGVKNSNIQSSTNIQGSTEFRVSLDAASPYEYLKWTNYNMNFENAYIKGFSDGSCTFQAKQSGLYVINFLGSFTVSGAGASGSYSRLVLEVTKKGFVGDTATRSIVYYSVPNDRFTLPGVYNMYCGVNEKVYIKIYFDDRQGTLSELMEKPSVRISYVK